MDIATAISILNELIKQRTEEAASFQLALDALKGNFNVQFVNLDALTAERDTLSSGKSVIETQLALVTSERDALLSENAKLKTGTDVKP